MSPLAFSSAISAIALCVPYGDARHRLRPFRGALLFVELLLTFDLLLANDHADRAELSDRADIADVADLEVFATLVADLADLLPTDVTSKISVSSLLAALKGE